MIFLLFIAIACGTFLAGWACGYSLGKENERERWRCLGEQRGWFGH